MQRQVRLRVFDLGSTHIDLANNSSSPYGAAERTFGRVLVQDLKPYRDEVVVSSKAGWDTWPGPYGAQLEENVRRLDHLNLSEDELTEIDAYAVEAGVDLWRSVSTA